MGWGSPHNFGVDAKLNEVSIGYLANIKHDMIFKLCMSVINVLPVFTGGAAALSARLRAQVGV